MRVNHSYIIQNSVCTSFKFGYVFMKKIFMLCEHGTKANIGGAKMSNNRHAINWNFLQVYCTSDGLSLYSSQSASLVIKHIQINTVKDLLRSGRPHVTSQREDRTLHPLVRWIPFATSPVPKRHIGSNIGEVQDM
jgi:hypothetical protein